MILKKGGMYMIVYVLIRCVYFGREGYEISGEEERFEDVVLERERLGGKKREFLKIICNRCLVNE